MTQPPITETPTPHLAEPHAMRVGVSASTAQPCCETKLRDELILASKDLHACGYTPGTSGNLSVRLSAERVLATPTGCSKSRIGTGDLIVVDMESRQLEGTRHVTSEIDMHLAIYKARPDVQAVVHAHPVFATAFACSGLALDQPLCAEVVMALGSIPLAPYATTGTCAVAKALAPFLPGHDAVLLANHGVVTYGHSLTDALMKMETVEHFAQICIAVRQLGGGALIAGEDMTALLRARTAYQRKAAPHL
jgi:L-fuculose-phosphate aldolase